MNRIREKLQRLMWGRNGFDSLGRFCVYTSLLFILVSGLLGRIPLLASLLNTIGMVMLFYGYFRVFSRNIQKRYEENRRFQKWTAKVTRRFQDKNHRYYKCTSCGQTIRVPKGKGRIEITCPKCKNKFIKKT